MYVLINQSMLQICYDICKKKLTAKNLLDIKGLSISSTKPTKRKINTLAPLRRQNNQICLQSFKKKIK